MNYKNLNKLLKLLLLFALTLIILVEVYDSFTNINVDNINEDNNVNNTNNLKDNFSHTSLRGRNYEDIEDKNGDDNSDITKNNDIQGHNNHGLDMNYFDILRKNQYLINSVEAFDNNSQNNNNYNNYSNLDNGKVSMKLASGKEIILDDNISDIKSIIDDKFDMNDNIYHINDVNVLKDNTIVKLYQKKNFKGKNIILRGKKDYLNLRKRDSNVIGVINDKRIVGNKWLVNDDTKILNIKSIEIMDDIESHIYNSTEPDNIKNIIEMKKTENDNYEYLRPIFVDDENNLDDVIKISQNKLKRYRNNTESINNDIKQKQYNIENNIKNINDRKNNIGLQQAANDYFFIKKLHNEVLEKNK